MKKHQIQQGDVLLKRVHTSVDYKTIYPKHHVISKDKCTLALGEVTGHHHTIEMPGTRIISVDGMKFLVVEQAGVLTHQEHKPVIVEPGIYQFGIVQEYDYFKEAKRNVRD